MDFMHADEEMMNDLAKAAAPNASHGHGHHGGHLVLDAGGNSHSGHSMDGHGGSANHGGDHMMSMYFHLGYEETILFSFWTINSLGGLIGSMVGIFLASMLYEGLKVFREFLLQRALASERSQSRTSAHHSANNSNGLRVPLAAENGESPDGASAISPPVKATFLRPHPFSVSHLFQSFLHMLQVFISYLLMLIFMTYNVWLALAVVLGAGAGYFLFGWRKKTIVDINEHCH